MVTRIRKSAKLHAYIEEWQERLGLNDASLGRRIGGGDGGEGVSATTVWRWRTQQWRLKPPTVEAIAKALNLDDPRQLFSPPPPESRPPIPLDALGDDDYKTVHDLAARLARRAS